MNSSKTSGFPLETCGNDEERTCVFLAQVEACVIPTQVEACGNDEERACVIPTKVEYCHGKSITYRFYFFEGKLYANFTFIERGATPLHGRFPRRQKHASFLRRLEACGNDEERACIIPAQAEACGDDEERAGVIPAQAGIQVEC
jgi:hypothetical protein